MENQTSLFSLFLLKQSEIRQTRRKSFKRNENDLHPLYPWDVFVIWKMCTFLPQQWNQPLQVKEVPVEYGSRSPKIDANLLKIHHWPGFNMAKCWCKWVGEKSALSLQINLSCRLQLINTTACHKSRLLLLMEIIGFIYLIQRDKALKVTPYIKHLQNMQIWL